MLATRFGSMVEPRRLSWAFVGWRRPRLSLGNPLRLGARPSFDMVHSAQMWAYSAVFGARTDPSETGGTYTTFSREGEQILGVLPIPEMVPSGAPAFWQIYFLVDDLDAAVVAATDRGASVLVPRMQIGEHAWFATLQDPQGAGFSLFAGDM